MCTEIKHPLAVILIVPMCLLSAITGVSLVGMDNNILTQIGFVVPLVLAVFSGMLGVTFFGLLFTPVFYVLSRQLATLGRPAPQAGAAVDHT